MRDAGLDGRIGDHFHDREQQRRLALALDDDAGEFRAGHLAVGALKFDLVAIGGGFTGKAPARIALDQLSVVGDDKVGQALADDVAGACVQHAEEARIGKQNGLGVDQHSLMHRFNQSLEQLVAVAVGTTTMAQ